MPLIFRISSVNLVCVKLRRDLLKNEHDMDHMAEGCVWQPEFGGWMVSHEEF